ncbi:MAG: TIGR04282 family arsenosugar biosynthesis glycosyltransferase [Spirochaetes bacterium]|nr:TIGR04282 family arsenosugar biosynthesis glycosyltransferase [Spirochaetota bacterium]
MKKDAVILFLRYPERGKMKTPLSAELGDDAAYDLTICFIRDILGTLRAVEAETIIVGTGSTGKGPPGIFGGTLRLVQRGHDPGERLYHAFADVFSRGFSRAVLIGVDCPGISAVRIRQAFSELGNHEAVIGPANDGGYYLAGFHDRSVRPDFFRDISWGTGRVLAETIGKIEDTLMELSILPQLERIETANDLRRFADERERSAMAASTMNYVTLNRERLFGEK